MRAKTGHVSLIGAGPGDPELLTLRGARRIADADVVVYDRLVHPGVLAHARPHARLIYVGKEGASEKTGGSTSQDTIHEILLTQARLGRRVARVKGGDPFVFGRGGEEALALVGAGVSVDVVPGVTSGVAAAAAAGIPVTHRGLAQSVTFATVSSADDDGPDWDFLARAETLVLFMGGRRLATIATALVAAGADPDARVAVVEAGTWERQRVVASTLRRVSEDAAAAGLGGGPSLVVVGAVVALREQLRDLVAGAWSSTATALTAEG